MYSALTAALWDIFKTRLDPRLLKRYGVLTFSESFPWSISDTVSDTFYHLMSFTPIVSNIYLAGIRINNTVLP